MKKATLLFEIGVEEMPSAPLYKAADELRIKAEESFGNAGLSYESLIVEFTPRRLFLSVEGLDSKQEDRMQVSRGPALAIARDEQGNFTKAAEGFARGKGLEAKDLAVRDYEGIEYLFAEQKISGKETIDLLSQILNSLINELSWSKSQRWGAQVQKFIRPVRWILALFDGDVVDLEFAGVKAGNKTFGHRFLAPQAIEVEDLDDYRTGLTAAFVVLSAKKRREMIVEQIEKLAAPFGTAIIDADVLDEVVNLCEYPNSLLGTFDSEFLEVPSEILLSAMQKHQRYFAIRAADGTLVNYFIVVSNGNPANASIIVQGHERVLRARLFDAHFFVKEDVQIPLEAWREKLSSLVFQRDLGTVLDKTKRIEALSGLMIDRLGLEDERADILRASSLCKADLVTNAVVEFTDLQGIMGAYYAQAQGESALVADIIQQHYQPRFSGDAIPSSSAARIVALADKIDTIMGIILIGKTPTGSSDPYAIRRNALGVISILSVETELNIFEILDFSASLYQQSGIFNDEHLDSVRAFFLSRLSRIYRDKGFRHDMVEAVLARFSGFVVDAQLRLSALQAFVSERPEDAANLFTALSRAHNLHDDAIGTEINEELFGEYELKLVDAIRQVHSKLVRLLERKDYGTTLEELSSLREPVDAFFENLMVLDKDEKIRKNRLAILNRLLQLFGEFADLTKVELSNGKL